jgi:hypothetical protein
MARLEKQLEQIAAVLESTEGDLAAREEAREKALLALLELCEKGAGNQISTVNSELRPRITARLLTFYRAFKGKLLPAQRPEGIDWMFEEGYAENRHLGGLLLDLLGYFPSPEAESELQEGLRYHDPRLKLFAVCSLLRIGRPVEPRDVFQVAANPEVRNWLYDRLTDFGRPDLYPHALKTQEAFAEGEIVQWLTYPTELGRVPDEIELMAVITEDMGPPEGLLDWYLFRFRTFPPHWAAEDGWIAGVAGPYLRKDAPGTRSYGDTFSKFTPWDSMTPEEHVADIRQLMHDWREHHFGNTQ